MAYRAYTRAVNDQHITAIATIVQDVLLFLSAGLIGWYLYETKKMRKAAENQVGKNQELVKAAQQQLAVSLLIAIFVSWSTSLSVRARLNLLMGLLDSTRRSSGSRLATSTRNNLSANLITCLAIRMSSGSNGGLFDSRLIRRRFQSSALVRSQILWSRVP
jgi:hypothetical protein